MLNSTSKRNIKAICIDLRKLVREFCFQNTDTGVYSPLFNCISVCINDECKKYVGTNLEMEYGHSSQLPRIVLSGRGNELTFINPQPRISNIETRHNDLMMSSNLIEAFFCFIIQNCYGIESLNSTEKQYIHKYAKQCSYEILFGEKDEIKSNIDDFGLVGLHDIYGHPYVLMAEYCPTMISSISTLCVDLKFRKSIDMFHQVKTTPRVHKVYSHGADVDYIMRLLTKQNNENQIGNVSHTRKSVYVPNKGHCNYISTSFTFDERIITTYKQVGKKVDEVMVTKRHVGMLIPKEITMSNNNIETVRFM